MTVSPQGTRPFEGVKILDFTQVLAGPYASFQLALMVADVVKVERREGEDAVLVHSRPEFCLPCAVGLCHDGGMLLVTGRLGQQHLFNCIFSTMSVAVQSASSAACFSFLCSSRVRLMVSRR